MSPINTSDTAKKRGLFSRLSACFSSSSADEPLKPQAPTPPTTTAAPNVTPMITQQQNIPFIVNDRPPYLPNQSRNKLGKKTLVLDLDETLVHSTFKLKSDVGEKFADHIIDLNIDNTAYAVYVKLRPFALQFLSALAPYYEVVIFTASMPQYAEPLLDLLDNNDIISARLFRSHCTPHEGLFVKDLTLLGRNLDDIVIIDNAPYSYMFQPDHAIPVTSWFSDPSDTELRDLIPFLQWLSSQKAVDRAIHDAVFETIDAPPATPHMRAELRKQKEMVRSPQLSPNVMAQRMSKMAVSPIYQMSESSTDDEFWV